MILLFIEMGIPFWHPAYFPPMVTEKHTSTALRMANSRWRPSLRNRDVATCCFFEFGPGWVVKKSHAYGPNILFGTNKGFVEEKGATTCPTSGGVSNVCAVHIGFMKLREGSSSCPKGVSTFD